MYENIPQVRLWNQHVAHGQHAKATQLFGSVEDYRRETARHFGVETDLDTCLNLVLTFHQQIEELLCVDYSLTEVRHQTNESSVPFVHNLKAKEIYTYWIMGLPFLQICFTSVCQRCSLLGRKISAHLSKSGGSRSHQDLTHSVVEALH